MKKKLLTALLVVLALAIAAVTVFAADTPAYTVDENGNITLDVVIYHYGDLDLNGTVEATDLTAMAKHVGRMEYLNDEWSSKTADVNRDGVIDASDLTILAKYVGRMINSFE